MFLDLQYLISRLLCQSMAEAKLQTRVFYRLFTILETRYACSSAVGGLKGVRKAGNSLMVCGKKSYVLYQIYGPPQAKIISTIFNFIFAGTVKFKSSNKNCGIQLFSCSPFRSYTINQGP